MKKTTIILFFFTSYSLFLSAQSTPKTEFEKQMEISLPDFPKLTNTGNAFEDEKSYALAKENWINQNPRAFEAIMKANSVDALPGFPQKIKTGNPDTDDAAFKIAKENWYQEYPEMLKLFYENNAKKYTPNFDKN
jgi:hypothetical protein